MKAFLANIIERRADKFLVAAIGSAVTAITAQTGLPVADFFTPAWISTTSAALTALAVYMVRNRA